MKKPTQAWCLSAAFIIASGIGFSQNSNSGQEAPAKADANAAAGRKDPARPVEMKDGNWDNPKPITKHHLTLKKIEVVHKDGKNFLKLTIDIPNFEKDFVPYPLFRVVSAGKVIAERGLETYGLTPVELIATDLESLPKDFACKVYIKVHGGPDTPCYLLSYPAADP